MIEVKKCKYLDGYRLELTFDDGSKGIADLEAEIHRGKAYAEIRDPKKFRRAKVEDGTVMWSDDLDIAPERLYALAHELPIPKTLEDVDANELAVSLRALRQGARVSQEALAERLELSQRAISHLETRADRAQLSSIRKYLRGLGYDLELVAVHGRKRVPLRG